MKTLPKQPNLDYLRREAKALKSQHRNSDRSICEVIGHFDLSLQNLNTETILKRNFSILDAQRVVARQYGFASWRRLNLYVAKCSSKIKFNSELNKKLLFQLNEVEAYIDSIGVGNFIKSDKPMLDDLTTAAANVMNTVFDQYGWPGPEIVGRDGVDACWMIVCHAVRDSGLNWRACELMENALPNGLIDGRAHALLLDRCLTLSGKPSVYGSSAGFDQNGRLLLSNDVIDADNLDRRRATVGFDSFETTKSAILERSKIEGWDVYADREEFDQYKLKLASEGGYI